MSVRKDRVVSLAQRVRHLLGSQHSWTQGELAQDANGQAVNPGDPGAIRFCLEGAVEHLTPNGSSATSEMFLKVLYRHLPAEFKEPIGEAFSLADLDHFETQDQMVSAINDFNDGSHHEEILKVLDQTLETLQDQETALPV